MSGHIAYAATRARDELRSIQVLSAELAAGCVRVAVTHCGVCHTDAHLVDDDWGIAQYPLVPGHEIVGEIVAIGPEVADTRLGRRVGIGWQASACLRCNRCHSGLEHLCRERTATCLGRAGGFATMV